MTKKPGKGIFSFDVIAYKTVNMGCVCVCVFVNGRRRVGSGGGRRKMKA